MIDVSTLCLGGSGCGLGVTLDPRDAVQPALDCFPETMMIDFSPGWLVLTLEASATIIAEPCPALVMSEAC
ncbi:hypothetical protein ACVWXO_000121 [Bradyrhizobium sp. LM2.7]